MTTTRYRLWLDGNGRPSVVECVGGEPDPKELEQIRLTLRNVAKREGTLIIGPEWAVQAVPAADEVLRRIEAKLDRMTTWSGFFSHADGRPITLAEKAEMDRHEAPGFYDDPATDVAPGHPPADPGLD